MISFLIGGLLIVCTLVLGHLFWEVERAKGLTRRMLADGKSLEAFVSSLWHKGFFAQEAKDFGVCGLMWDVMLSQGANWPAIIDVELQSTKASYMTPQCVMGTMLFVVVVVEGIFLPISFAISVVLLFVLLLFPQGKPSAKRARINLGSLCWLVYNFNKNKPEECKKFTESFTQFENLRRLTAELKAKAREEPPANENASPEAAPSVPIAQSSSWVGVDRRPVRTEQNASDDAQWITDFVMQEINNLVVKIISTSWEYTQAIKSYLRPNKSLRKHPESQQAYIHFLFLGFFLRLMSFQACNVGLNRPAFSRLKETVLPLIVSTQVAEFFGDRPDKSELESMFHKALGAETPLDEGSSKTFEDSLKGISLDFGRDIIRMAGYPLGNGHHLDADASLILNVVQQKFAEICDGDFLANFEFLIRSASAAIESCRDGGVSIPTIVKKAMVQRGASPA